MTIHAGDGGQRRDLATLLRLCDSSSSVPVPPTEDAWADVTALAAAHGLLSLCYHRTTQLGVSLPASIAAEMRGAHLRDRILESAALRQLGEVRALLAGEGVPMLVLKGASAIVRLYPAPGLRTMADLDILIPANRGPQCEQILREAGYEEVIPFLWTSAEDRILYAHPIDLVRRGGLPLEGHTDPLFGGGDATTAAADVWGEAKADGPGGLSHLSREHFVIHSLLHWRKHVQGKGFAQLKGLVDVLYAARRWKIDWKSLWSTARRWGVEKEILPVAQAVCGLWNLDIPVPRDADGAADVDAFRRGLIAPPGRQDLSRVPASYARRILRVRELPTASQRFRYLFRLCFPVAGHIRRRYDLSPGRSVWPYYLVHGLKRTTRLLAGLMRQAFGSHPRA